MPCLNSPKLDIISTTTYGLSGRTTLSCPYHKAQYFMPSGAANQSEAGDTYDRNHQ